MARPGSTCWTVIHGASAGKEDDREEFAYRYGPVIRAYLAARWQTSLDHQEVDDGVQEVFAECFKQGGVLDRADPKRPGGFRSFLRGVAHNVAMRIEGRKARRREAQAPSDLDLDAVRASEATLSNVFDRAWARSIMDEAADLQAKRARAKDEDAVRRVELLRLRFDEELPIRKIARLWEMEPLAVHRQYELARKEFKRALMEVVKFHHPGSAEEAKREIAELRALLR